MKKWYEIQFIGVAVLNVLTFLIITVGQILSKRDYLYRHETMTVNIALLVVSGVIMVLGTLYNKPKN